MRTMKKPGKPQSEDTEVTNQTQEAPKHVEAVNEEAEVWKAKYVRALADYQNVVRRAAEEGKEIYARTEKDLVAHLIPIADLFDKVLSHDPYKQDHGLKAVRSQLSDVLRSYGVEGKPVMGLAFDPQSMECVDTREPNEGEKTDNVVDVVLPLYMHRGAIYRPAQVIVAKRTN